MYTNFHQDLSKFISDAKSGGGGINQIGKYQMLPKSEPEPLGLGKGN